MRAVILFAALLAVTILGLAHTATASANTNISSSSSCGLHAGALLNRNSGGSTYRFRMGPRMYHSGGDMRCVGWVRKPGSAASTTDGCCSINWQPFSLPDWRSFFNARIASTDVTTGLTAYSCGSFGMDLAAILISDGWATPALVIGAGGCIWGVHRLGPKIPTGITNLKYVKVVR